MQRKIEDLPLHHLWSVSSQRSEGKRCEINPSCCNRAQQKHVILERADHKHPPKKVIYCGEERSKNGCELVHVTEHDVFAQVCIDNQHAWSNMSMKSVRWVKIQRKQKHAESLWLSHSVIIGSPLTKCQWRFVSVIAVCLYLWCCWCLAFSSILFVIISAMAPAKKNKNTHTDIHREPNREIAYQSGKVQTKHHCQKI